MADIILPLSSTPGAADLPRLGALEAARQAALLRVPGAISQPAAAPQPQPAG